MKTWIDNLGNRTIQLNYNGQLATLDKEGNLDIAGIKISKKEIDWLYESVRKEEAHERHMDNLYGH